ncbi:MAG TPA: SDR family NAD(P)-dependent oxidoreductase [Acidimicrobiales bacterium]|nr:SDR family NAD(P)-dependent oxidoreductase [Acidimicrobiales bacterium]
MSELRFDGRVAVITGAGGGLGREHALLLASRGASVVVNDLGASPSGEGGDEGPAAHTAREIGERGGAAVADTSDVATPEGGEAVVAAALEAFGRVDIVVNNAGFLRDKAFHNMTPDLLRPLLAVHVEGAFNVTRPAWVRMREQGYGRVVFTTSSSGILGNFGQSNYGAAKTALIGLTRVLAIEGARSDIKVNAIAPLARTRLTDHLMGSVGERLDPRLVSPVVAWLAHAECPVSGEVFAAGGGRVARFFTGMTPGMFDPDLTVEAVRDHADLIRSEEGYTTPGTLTEEITELFARFSEQDAGEA